MQEEQYDKQAGRWKQANNMGIFGGKQVPASVFLPVPL